MKKLGILLLVAFVFTIGIVSAEPTYVMFNSDAMAMGYFGFDYETGLSTDPSYYSSANDWYWNSDDGRLYEPDMNPYFFNINSVGYVGGLTLPPDCSQVGWDPADMVPPPDAYGDVDLTNNDVFCYWDEDDGSVYWVGVMTYNPGTSFEFEYDISTFEQTEFDYQLYGLFVNFSVAVSSSEVSVGDGWVSVDSASPANVPAHIKWNSGFGVDDVPYRNGVICTSEYCSNVVNDGFFLEFDVTGWSNYSYGPSACTDANASTICECNHNLTYWESDACYVTGNLTIDAGLTYNTGNGYDIYDIIMLDGASINQSSGSATSIQFNNGYSLKAYNGSMNIDGYRLSFLISDTPFNFTNADVSFSETTFYGNSWVELHDSNFTSIWNGDDGQTPDFDVNVANGIVMNGNSNVQFGYDDGYNSNTVWFRDNIDIASDVIGSIMSSSGWTLPWSMSWDAGADVYIDLADLLNYQTIVTGYLNSSTGSISSSELTTNDWTNMTYNTNGLNQSKNITVVMRDLFGGSAGLVPYKDDVICSDCVIVNNTDAYFTTFNLPTTGDVTGVYTLGSLGVCDDGNISTICECNADLSQGWGDNRCYVSSNLTLAGGSYYLPSQAVIYVDQDITLDGNGSSIYFSSANDQSYMFSTSSGVTIKNMFIDNIESPTNGGFLAVRLAPASTDSTWDNITAMLENELGFYASSAVSNFVVQNSNFTLDSQMVFTNYGSTSGSYYFYNNYIEGVEFYDRYTGALYLENNTFVGFTLFNSIYGSVYLYGNNITTTSNAMTATGIRSFEAEGNYFSNNISLTGYDQTSKFNISDNVFDGSYYAAKSNNYWFNNTFNSPNAQLRFIGDSSIKNNSYELLGNQKQVEYVFSDLQPAEFEVYDDDHSIWYHGIPMYLDGVYHVFDDDIKMGSGWVWVNSNSSFNNAASVTFSNLDLDGFRYDVLKDGIIQTEGIDYDFVASDTNALTIDVSGFSNWSLSPNECLDLNSSTLCYCSPSLDQMEYGECHVNGSLTLVGGDLDLNGTIVMDSGDILDANGSNITQLSATNFIDLASNVLIENFEYHNSNSGTGFTTGGSLNNITIRNGIFEQSGRLADFSGESNLVIDNVSAITGEYVMKFGSSTTTNVNITNSYFESNSIQGTIYGSYVNNMYMFNNTVVGRQNYQGLYVTSGGFSGVISNNDFITGGTGQCANSGGVIISATPANIEFSNNTFDCGIYAISGYYEFSGSDISGRFRLRESTIIFDRLVNAPSTMTLSSNGAENVSFYYEDFNDTNLELDYAIEYLTIRNELGNSVYFEDIIGDSTPINNDFQMGDDYVWAETNSSFDIPATISFEMDNITYVPYRNGIPCDDLCENVTNDGTTLTFDVFGFSNYTYGEPNEPPVIVQMIPNETNQNIYSGSSLNLSIEATDADNDTLTYTWSNDGVNISSYNYPYYLFVTEEGDVEEHNISVTVEDLYYENSTYWMVNILYYPVTLTSLIADQTGTTIRVDWITNADSMKIYVDDVLTASSTGISYTIEGLSPNTTYEIKLQPVKDGLFGEPDILNATTDETDNNAPVMVSTTITPTTVYTDTTLTGSCRATDIDSIKVFYTYDWYVNDIVVKSGVTSLYDQGQTVSVGSILNSYYVKGDNVTLSCVANDGLTEDGELNTTVNVSNSQAQIDEVFLIEYNATDYFCNYTYVDVDDDPEIESSYMWYKNGAVTGNVSQSVPISEFASGDQIVCEVTTGDGIAENVSSNSSTFTVGDTTDPVLELLKIKSDVETDEPVLIEASCSDDVGVAGGFPLIRMINPNLVQLQYSFFPTGEDNQYYRYVTFSTAGTYTDVEIFCSDGNGNEVSVTADDIVSTTPEVIVSTGGGGGGGEPEEEFRDIVSFDVVPDRLVLNVAQGATVLNEFQVVNEDIVDLDFTAAILRSGQDEIVYDWLNFPTDKKAVIFTIEREGGLATNNYFVPYTISVPDDTPVGTYVGLIEINGLEQTETIEVEITVVSPVFTNLFAFFERELFTLPFTQTVVPTGDVISEDVTTTGVPFRLWHLFTTVIVLGLLTIGYVKLRKRVKR